MARELGSDPSHDQLALALGISPRKLSTLVQSSQDLLSLDMSIGENSGTTLGGLIKDTRNDDPESASRLSPEPVAVDPDPDAIEAASR